MRSTVRGKGVRLGRGSSGLAALLGIVMLFAAAHDAPAASKTPDIFGIWMALESKSPNYAPQFKNKPNTPAPEFTAWAAVKSKEQGRLGVELPTPGACEPINPAGYLGGGLFPNQILEGHNQIVLMNEWVAVPRRIYTDGRPHPPAEDMLPSWEGHSIGHWEGDTLVIETVGLREDTMIEQSGLPHSSELKVQERIRLVGPDALENEITMIDPRAFTTTWTTTIHVKRHRDWHILDYVCAENNRNPVSATGKTLTLGSDGQPIDKEH